VTGPEFAVVVRLDRIGPQWSSQKLVADAAVRGALAQRFELLALDRLEASVRWRRVDGGTAVLVEGDLSASVVQACVATGLPVPATIAEPFNVKFVPADQIDDDALDVWDPQDLEPLPDNEIDIGELVAQSLSLALDPYPRVGEEAPRG
jgi:uncharacterized metal-binding protein YceD (DUF177 family)